jgi:hypothetical protein
LTPTDTHLDAAGWRGTKGVPGTPRDKVNFGELLLFLVILLLGSTGLLTFGHLLRLRYRGQPLFACRGRRDTLWDFVSGHAEKIAYVLPSLNEFLAFELPVTLLFETWCLPLSWLWDGLTVRFGCKRTIA